MKPASSTSTTTNTLSTLFEIIGVFYITADVAGYTHYVADDSVLEEAIANLSGSRTPQGRPENVMHSLK